MFQSSVLHQNDEAVQAVQANEELQQQIEELKGRPSPLLAAKAKKEEHLSDREKFLKLIENLQVLQCLQRLYALGMSQVTDTVNKTYVCVPCRATRRPCSESCRSDKLTWQTNRNSWRLQSR